MIVVNVYILYDKLSRELKQSSGSWVQTILLASLILLGTKLVLAEQIYSQKHPNHDHLKSNNIVRWQWICIYVGMCYCCIVPCQISMNSLYGPAMTILFFLFKHDGFKTILSNTSRLLSGHVIIGALIILVSCPSFFLTLST